MKSNRMTNEELNKRWDYVGDNNISWYYGDKPKCYLNNERYRRYEKEYKENFVKLDEIIPPNVFGKKFSDIYENDSDVFNYVTYKSKYKDNKDFTDIVDKLNSLNILMNIEGVDAYMCSIYGDDKIAVYEGVHGTIYKVDDNIIQGEMNIKYGNGETYNLIIFNNYMGKTTTFNMWRGFSGKCGIENYCINCDNDFVSSYVFDIDKDRVEKVLNSIDKDDTYGIIYKELRDLALKMIKEDKINER